MIDRRGGEDRRKVPRYAVNIDVQWETADGLRRGTIGDISLDGCFILCSGEVENGDKVRVFLPIGDRMRMQVNGSVVNHFYEIGFAVLFFDLGDAPRKVLLDFIATLK